jgi:hypothetical protein
VVRSGKEPDRLPGMLWGPRDPNAPEPQHILGFPAGWFGQIDTEWFLSFVHPVKTCRRWARRRRLGAYALDEDDTPPSR